MMPLPWQQDLWHSLTAREAAGRLPHALLFYGARGMGKWQLAKAFASYLLCEARTSEGQPCGRCRGCTLFAAGTHPDFTVCAPEEEGKSITIDMIRELAAQLAMTSQYGGYKVVLLNPADKMNTASANSLLKTLEEPTPRTILILITAQIDALLPTIRSRCQKILFARPPRDITRSWLISQHQVATQQADLLLNLADDAPLRALEYAQTELLQQRADLLKVLDRLARGKTHPVAAVEESQALSPEALLGWLTRWTMALIRYKFTEFQEDAESPEVTKHLQQYASALDLEHLYGFYDRLLAAGRLAKTQVNAQLLLEDVMTAWMRLHRQS
ncbi:MAG: DNA polymerase III subunit delta' [Pseudomonadota bacterium]